MCLFLQAKRLSQHELGATHPVTLDIMMIYGEHLVCHGRYQQGLSYYQKALRLRHETCGPYHHMVMAAQVRFLWRSGARDCQGFLHQMTRACAIQRPAY